MSRSLPAYLAHGWRRGGGGIVCPTCDTVVSTNALARAAHRCGWVVYRGSGSGAQFWSATREAWVPYLMRHRATVYGYREHAEALRLQFWNAGDSTVRTGSKGLLK